MSSSATSGALRDMRRWEQAPEHTWDVIQEDDRGELVVVESAAELLRKRRR
jgi:hypothetical protein